MSELGPSQTQHVLFIIICSKYVLTAAHCVCQAEKGMECKLLEGRMRVAYNVSSFFNIQIGTHTSRQVIPGLGTSGSNSVFIKCKQPWKFIRAAHNSHIFQFYRPDPKKMFRAKRAIVHYRYRFLEQVPAPNTSQHGRDIALLELDRAVTPDAKLMPACLPPGVTTHRKEFS